MYSGFFFSNFQINLYYNVIPKSLKNHKNFPVQIKKIDRQIWQKLFYMYYFIVFWKVPLYLIFSWFSWSRICIKQANYLLFWFFFNMEDRLSHTLALWMFIFVHLNFSTIFLQWNENVWVGFDFKTAAIICFFWVFFLRVCQCCVCFFKFFCKYS